MNKFLLKRSPDFTNNGVIIKRNDNNKYFYESRINSTPLSNKLKKGDVIYIAESDYGIYAKGIFTCKSDIIIFGSLDDIVEYYIDHKFKDQNYWFSLLQKLKIAKLKRKDSKLYFQHFKVNLKLLEKVIPLNGELEKLKIIQTSIAILDNDLVHFIENPTQNIVKELVCKIPNSLRFDLYSLFSTHCNLSFWVDIDHFVPQSIGGPGNIVENLIPVGLNLNRYKSDSIPIGLFIEAYKHEETKKYVSSEILNIRELFLKTKNAKDNASKIVKTINQSFNIEKCKAFYKAVLEYHHPEYVKIISGI
jgi:hypothetical protein